MTPCIDGETLAAWSAGALGPAEAANVEGHIADCARCQAMLALFVRTEPVAPPHPAWWQHWQVRWLVPLATAATVAAIWIATPEQNVSVRQPIEPQMSTPPAPLPAAPPTTQSTPSAAEKRYADSVAPPTVGGAASARRAEGTIDSLEQKRDLQANAASAREERQSTAPKPSAAPVPPPATFSASTPAPAPPASPRALQESVAVTANTDAIAQRRAGVVEIVSPNPAVRWRILSGQQLDRTTDSGARWERVAIPADMVLTAGHSPAANVAWLVGPAGAIAVTNNGTRFDRVPFAETADLVDVVAVNDREATVTTSDARVFHTTDRGATWTRR